QGGREARRGGPGGGAQHPAGGEGQAPRAGQGQEDLGGRREAQRGGAAEADRPLHPAGGRAPQEEGAGDPRVLTAPDPGGGRAPDAERLATGPAEAPGPPELDAALLESLRRPPVPRHVAIIMAGNGRWAGSRDLPRVAGHREGVKAARAAVRAASRMGIEYLTLYAFSSENWTRPPAEVSFLMQLLESSVEA